MKDIQEKKIAIKQLVAKDISTGLKSLSIELSIDSTSQNSLYAILARFHRADTDFNMGKIDLSERENILNNISNAIFKLIDELAENDFKVEINENNQVAGVEQALLEEIKDIKSIIENNAVPHLESMKKIITDALHSSDLLEIEIKLAEISSVLKDISKLLIHFNQNLLRTNENFDKLIYEQNNTLSVLSYEANSNSSKTIAVLQSINETFKEVLNQRMKDINGSP